MARVPAVRRQTLLKDLPRGAAIPKFLQLDEIRRIKKMKEDRPDLEWDEVVQQVVFSSVRDISSIVGVQ